MIRGFIPVRWWKKQEAVLQKVLLLYPEDVYKRQWLRLYLTAIISTMLKVRA